MSSDQRAHSMTLFVWVAILCIAVTGFGIVVGGAAESTTADVDTKEAFAVNVTGLNTSVTEGDTIVAEATIRNEGSAADSQQIHLKNDDNEIVDSIAGPPLTLEPGESENVTLTWETGPGDAMTGEVTVVSNHGQDSREVRIEEGTFLTIESVGSNSPVTAGNTLDATVTMTNPGTQTITQNVWIAVDDDTVAETSVVLPPGWNQTVTLPWTPTTAHTGTLTVGTLDDQRTTDVVVLSPRPAENRSEQLADRSPPTADESRDEEATDGQRTVSFPERDVRRIAFERDTAPGQVTVDRLQELPGGVTTPGDSIGLYRIDPAGTLDSEHATVRFAYPTETVGDAEPDAIEVVRWDGDAWTALDADVRTTDGEVTIDAETDGFSLFAVTTVNETSEDETPGFGTITALLSLITASGFVAYRRL